MNISFLFGERLVNNAFMIIPSSPIILSLTSPFIQLTKSPKSETIVNVDK